MASASPCALQQCLCSAALWVVVGAAAVAGQATCAAGRGGRVEGPLLHSERVVLSEHPRVYLLEDFLKASEVAHLVGLMRELGALWPAKGETPDGYHQDYVPADRYEGDAVLSALEGRLSLLANIPFEAGSSHRISLSVRNSTAAGLANVHHDHKAAAQIFPVREMLEEGQVPTANMLASELQATLLGYLEASEGGGETIFPCICNRTLKSCRSVQHACRSLYERGLLEVHPGPGVVDRYLRKPSPEAQGKASKSKEVLLNAAEALCAGRSDSGLKIAPRAGRALFFFSNSVRGTADPRAWHGSCKVTKGRKLTMQRFVYAPEGDEETGKHTAAMLSG